MGALVGVAIVGLVFTALGIISDYVLPWIEERTK